MTDVQLAPKTPAWKNELNPEGPPADPTTATPIDAEAMADLEARVNTALASVQDAGTAAAGAVKGLPLGLTGAVTATRYVGGTASSAPSSGTFSAGDFVVTTAGSIYICTAGGTPGTWVAVSGVSVTPSSTTPIIDGTAAVGTGTTYARADHVHPTDTSRAATSAIPAAGSASPIIDGTAAAGTSTSFSRQDHVHPTDTTRAATSALPAAGTSSPIIDGTAAAGSSTSYSRQDHVHPTDTTRAPLTPRINSTASSATPAINVGTTDEFEITALALAITSMSSGLTGTAVDGQQLIIRIKDNGTARAITWGSSFVSSGIATLLATTAISKTHTIGLRYDAAAAKWVCLAVDATGY